MELANLNWAEGFHVRDRTCVREWREANDSEILDYDLDPLPGNQVPLVYRRSVDGGGTVLVTLSGGCPECGNECSLVVKVHYCIPDGHWAWFCDSWYKWFHCLRMCRNLISEFEILSLDGSDGDLALLWLIVRGQGMSFGDSDIPMYIRMADDDRHCRPHERPLSSIFPWAA